MFTQLRNSFFLGCVAVATCLIPSVNAEEITPTANNQTITSVTVTVTDKPTNNDPQQLAQALSQLQSIQQLRDVDPLNWSYEALKNLVEEYGCIVGYPDRTFRGDRALSRYEFAAGLNACMQALEARMISLIRAQTAEVTREQVVPSQDSEDVSRMFNRAFFHNTGTFSDLYNISGQLNSWLGWRTFPGSFVENLIDRDSQLIREISQDLIDQSTSLPRLRTQDLANPFNTSLNENPGYLSPAQPTSVTTDSIIIEPGSIFP